MTSLNSIRAQLVTLIKQAGAISCQVAYSDDVGTLAVDAEGNVNTAGCAQAPYSPVTRLAELSLPDLARLAEVAAHELSLTPAERAEREQRQASERLYSARKNAANHFSFSDELCSANGYSIGASSAWENYKTAQWMADVFLDHQDTGVHSGKLVVEFADETADVLHAKLTLDDGTLVGSYSPE